MDRAVEAWEDARARASEGGARVRAARVAMVTVMATVKTRGSGE